MGINQCFLGLFLVVILAVSNFAIQEPTESEELDENEILALALLELLSEPLRPVPEPSIPKPEPERSGKRNQVPRILRPVPETPKLGPEPTTPRLITMPPKQFPRTFRPIAETPRPVSELLMPVKEPPRPFLEPPRAEPEPEHQGTVAESSRPMSETSRPAKEPPQPLLEPPRAVLEPEPFGPVAESPRPVPVISRPVKDPSRAAPSRPIRKPLSSVSQRSRLVKKLRRKMPKSLRSDPENIDKPLSPTVFLEKIGNFLKTFTI